MVVSTLTSYCLQVTKTLKHGIKKQDYRNKNMKSKLQIMLGASIVSVLAMSARAQDMSAPRTDGPNYVAGRSQRPHDLSGAAKVTDIIGMQVQNLQDEKLGKVNDLALDLESGRIVEVCVSSGGMLGMDKTYKAVPPGALRYDRGQPFLRLDASKERFNAAPGFDTLKWNEGTQSNEVTEVYGYYGEQSYFLAMPDGDKSVDLHGAPAGALPLNMDGTTNTDGARTVDRAHNAEVVRNAQETDNWISTRDSWCRLGYVSQTSRLMDITVKNLQDEKLGKVENFVVDLSSGRIIAVIISSGGFMGINGELSAVPPSAFRFNEEHDALLLDASREMLSAAPHFNANQWPDFRQPGYTMGVYRAYRVEPYFSTRVAGQPDNSTRNDQDRNQGALTPLDQGHSQADIDVTTQIRKDILADDGMSVNAKNVKIITVDGRVTLRGMVNSDQEKHHVGEIANQVAHPGNVDNQLEVAVNNSNSN
jgi:hyperosmotically inducible protein